MADISKIWSVSIGNVGKLFVTSKSSAKSFMGAGNIPAVAAGRGIFSGNDNTIQYVSISTFGNTQDFGDLTDGRAPSASSNGSNGRAVFFGGNGNTYNTIDYITMSTPGNATDFGDISLEENRCYGCASVSNGTSNRSMNAMGVKNTNTPASCSNRIYYFNIASTGNATSYIQSSVGPLTRRSGLSNSVNDRGVFAAGQYDSSTMSTGYTNIEYTTISTASSCANFGNLNAGGRTLAAGISNGTSERGIFAGGYNRSSVNINIVEYITVNAAGNSIDFGDLTSAKRNFGGTSNGTSNRGIFAGGYSTDYINNIDYITINSTGNAADFGDVAIRLYVYQNTGTSDC